MKNPLISIIIPIYNSAEYLEECLLSIKKQTYTKIEVILVDDGSMDGSILICQKFIENDERFRLCVQENQGVSTARNLGLQCARGEYIAFVDSDDIIDVHYIEYLYEAIKNYNVHISVCDRYIFSDNLPNVNGSSTVQIRDVNESFFERSMISNVWGRMFTKKILKELRFDTSIYVGEDLLFFCSILKRVNKVAIISGKLYFYRMHGESACHGTYTLKKYTEIDAWMKVRDLFLDDQQILRKFNSMFGFSMMWHFIGIRTLGKYNDRIIYLKQWMRKVLFDFMTVTNPMVQLRHRLLCIGLLYSEDFTIWLYERWLKLKSY